MKPCRRCKLRKPDACFNYRTMDLCDSCLENSQRGGKKVHHIRTFQANPITPSADTIAKIEVAREEKEAFKLRGSPVVRKIFTREPFSGTKYGRRSWERGVLPKSTPHFKE